MNIIEKEINIYLKEFKEEWTKVDYWDREKRQKREKYPEDYQKHIKTS